MRRWLIPLLLTLGLFTDWMLLSWLNQQLGFARTLLIVVAFIPWGLYLQFTQGARVRDQLFDAFRTGQRIPETAMEGVMVMVGGVLMIVPGVMSSLLGLAMVLPLSRRTLSPLVLNAITMMLPDVSGVGTPGTGVPGAGAPGGSSVFGVRVEGASARGTAAGFGSTGFGPDVVDANPNGRRAAGGSRSSGRASSSGSAGSSSGGPRAPRKSIDAEVVRIERNDPPNQGR